MKKRRIIFFGTDAFSVPSLISLITEGYNVVGVVTKPDTRTGRGRELTAPAVKRLAQAQEIPVFQPVKLTEIYEPLKALRPDAGIVVAYGKLIPPSVLGLFPDSLINVHASLLPRYRGASPIESAILAADDATGVTLMKLDVGMDTGPTYASSKYQLAGDETRLDLHEHLAEIGADLLAAKLPGILSGAIVAIPQDSSKASSAGMISKADGVIDWHKPADQLEREIRAYLGWPGNRTTIAGTDVTVTAAHIEPQGGRAGTAYKTSAADLAIYTADGSLVIDRLIPAGKREMTGPEFLAGHTL